MRAQIAPSAIVTAVDMKSIAEHTQTYIHHIVGYRQRNNYGGPKKKNESSPQVKVEINQSINGLIQRWGKQGELESCRSIA